MDVLSLSIVLCDDHANRKELLRVCSDVYVPTAIVLHEKEKKNCFRIHANALVGSLAKKKETGMINRLKVGNDTFSATVCEGLFEQLIFQPAWHQAQMILL